MTTLIHHPNCSAEYPEKVPGEAKQQFVYIDLHDGTFARQCVDCGAHVIFPPVLSYGAEAESLQSGCE